MALSVVVFDGSVCKRLHRSSPISSTELGKLALARRGLYILMRFVTSLARPVESINT